MRRRAAKRKREEDAEKKAKINNGISKYFNNAQPTVATSKPKVRTPEPLQSGDSYPRLMLRSKQILLKTTPS